MVAPDRGRPPRRPATPRVRSRGGHAAGGPERSSTGTMTWRMPASQGRQGVAQARVLPVGSARTTLAPSAVAPRAWHALPLPPRSAPSRSRTGCPPAHNVSAKPRAWVEAGPISQPVTAPRRHAPPPAPPLVPAQARALADVGHPRPPAGTAPLGMMGRPPGAVDRLVGIVIITGHALAVSAGERGQGGRCAAKHAVELGAAGPGRHQRAPGRGRPARHAARWRILGG